MKKSGKLDVTIVSDELPEGCGLDTYNRSLISNLIRSGVNVQLSSTKKLFGNYPVSLSSRVNTKIVHFTDQRSAAVLFFSPFRNYKAVVTVHDVIEIINFSDVCNLNTFRKKITHLLWAWMLKKGLNRADVIIAVSEHTRKDIMNVIGFNNRINVIYEASNFRLNAKINRKINHSILYLGSDLAHKNLKTLLKAFNLVLKKMPQTKLVLGGRYLYSNDAVNSLIRQFNLEDKVYIKGYIPDMVKEYSRAGVFVFPSLYEGFGLPVLEAMACGCPVICSDKTSLPEVAGDAAIYFDGYDAEDLSEKICSVMMDSRLRERMVKRGLDRSKKFSWKKCAEQTVKVYKELL